MNTKMRSKARKQRKVMQIFSVPIKILSKVGDFYVKGMENCNNRVSFSSWIGCPSTPGVRLTRNFSFNSFTASDDEEFGQLLRAASEKKTRQTALQTSMMGRSYSISVGKIGRIEEDKPCAFEEDGLKSELVYLKSRSHVVGRTYVYQK
ncbi:3-isopropylmalate dehydratase large subunit like [Melia azedarach]|uniref:3-isopropylmalate dehydratase large subunit like n=1 Tax=Melia azedarach TaxID=155640 RepID=A0ACC1XZG5_MELAZ|nr:3-isopropylmalate dehydratase large subunit like [Melia azedarach]